MTATLIIEDEEPAALRLQKLLKSLDPDINPHCSFRFIKG
jgi:hypothetical protein